MCSKRKYQLKKMFSFQFSFHICGGTGYTPHSKFWEIEYWSNDIHKWHYSTVVELMSTLTRTHQTAKQVCDLAHILDFYQVITPRIWQAASGDNSMPYGVLRAFLAMDSCSCMHNGGLHMIKTPLKVIVRWNIAAGRTALQLLLTVNVSRKLECMPSTLTMDFGKR